MFANDFNEKIFQTLPGQGWQVLIDWNWEPEDSADGAPRFTLEPVVAWVTAKVTRMELGEEREEVIIAPLVRWPHGDELTLLNTREDSARKHIYLAPGEALTDEHFAQLEGGYRKGVPRG